MSADSVSFTMRNVTATIRARPRRTQKIQGGPRRRTPGPPRWIYSRSFIRGDSPFRNMGKEVSSSASSAATFPLFSVYSRSCLLNRHRLLRRWAILRHLIGLRVRRYCRLLDRRGRTGHIWGLGRLRGIIGNILRGRRRRLCLYLAIYPVGQVRKQRNIGLAALCSTDNAKNAE